jgi:DNA-binding winged helix-turn-helix (wHTH) protein/TolB-like protein/Tfp pilus assembly protein PilF
VISRPAKYFYEFGPFRLDPAEHTLLREGQTVPLTPKVFDILKVLVDNSGHVLTKDELMKVVWPDSFVEEGNLTRNISTLRTALGEKTDEQYIETVPKRGYRFVARVKKLEGDNGDLVVKEHFRSPVVVEEPPQGIDSLNHAERSFEQDPDLPTPDMTVVNAGAMSRAGPPALVSQSPSVNASAAPLLRVTRGRLAAILIGLAGIIAVLGYAFFFRSARPTRQPEIKSLAVLPLKSVNKGPSDDYLGLPLADTIITRVSQISELTVRPISAVRKYANQETSSLEAGQQLKVDSVLDGTVQREGDRLRVNLNLLRVSDGALLWSESFNMSFTDSFTTQDEVAREVATRLQLKLKPPGQATLSSPRRVNPEVYEYYLRAKYHFGLQNKADMESAIELLEHAIAIDPNFAPAYADLAHVYRNKAVIFKPEEKEWEEKAFVAVETALKLDPNLADAHLSRGFLLWTHSNHFPHEQAVQEYRRALELNPNLDEAHHQLANVYNHIGLLDKGLEEVRRAVAINPGNSGARFRIGGSLLYQHKYQDALNAFAEAKGFNPPLWGYQTAWALFQLGRVEEARARVEETLKAYPQDEGGSLTSMQAIFAAAAGDNDRAEEKIKKAAQIGKGYGHFHHTAYAIASAYALMNKPDQAIVWLRNAVEDGFPCYPLFAGDSNLDRIRQHPSFIAFMAREKERWEHYKTVL